MTDALPMHGAARLQDRGIMRARGADAGKFLQGQLTNDVMALDSAHARLAGFCSAKGRLQASFVVWRASDDDFYLVCSRDLLAATLKRLTMFVLRAKCTLSDASEEIDLWGVVGEMPMAGAQELGAWGKREHAGRTTVRLPDAGGQRRLLVAVPAGAAGEGRELHATALSLEAWNWLDVRSGIVGIEAATVDRFVPQMVNFELVGGVDFQKGCYPGQEVVARSQYRGTTKRRTFLFACDELPVPGQDVFAAGDAGEAAGVVASAARDPGGNGGSALVEVRLAALDRDLRLGAANGAALRRIALPYVVPVEADAAA